MIHTKNLQRVFIIVHSNDIEIVTGWAAVVGQGHLDILTVRGLQALHGELVHQDTRPGSVRVDTLLGGIAR